MAQEIGLGVLPWSPLKIGALSGKYTRQNRKKMEEHRGAFAGETQPASTTTSEIGFRRSHRNSRPMCPQ